MKRLDELHEITIKSTNLYNLYSYRNSLVATSNEHAWWALFIVVQTDSFRWLELLCLPNKSLLLCVMWYEDDICCIYSATELSDTLSFNRNMNRIFLLTYQI